jgi:hypothetical protein
MGRTGCEGKRQLPNLRYYCGICLQRAWEKLSTASVRIIRVPARFRTAHLRNIRSRQQAKQGFMLVSCVAYSSILQMEATCSSETSVDFQPTTGRYIPEHRTSYKNSCDFDIRPILHPLALQSPVITICTTRFNTLKLCIPPTECLCFVWFSQ